jgi:hypothetical protein
MAADLEEDEEDGEEAETQEQEEGDDPGNDEDGNEDEAGDSSFGRRRSSAAPSIFPSDPVGLKLSPATEVPQSQSAVNPPSPGRHPNLGLPAGTGSTTAKTSPNASYTPRPSLLTLVRASSRRLPSSSYPFPDPDHDDIDEEGAQSRVSGPGPTESVSPASAQAQSYSERSRLLPKAESTPTRGDYGGLLGVMETTTGVETRRSSTAARRRSSAGGTGARRPSGVGSIGGGGNRRRLSAVKKRIAPDVGQSTDGQTVRTKATCYCCDCCDPLARQRW